MNYFTEIFSRIRLALRLIRNKARIGKVLSVDYVTATCTVELAEGLRTPSIKWVTLGAGSKRQVWNPPSVGERGIVVAIGDDAAQSLFIAGVFCTDTPPNSNADNLYKETFSDGSFIEYNLATSTLTANIQGGANIITTGNITATSGASITIDATGSVSVIAGGDASIDCANASVTASAGVDVTAPSGVTVTAPTAIFSGTVTATGGLLTGAGIATVTGVPVVCTGGFETTEDVVAGGVSLKTHTHPENGDGGGTTGAPI